MERNRIDNWLKHVCLFRSRSEATEACRGGHVKVNGQRVKASANVQEGDVIELLAGKHYRRVVIASVPETQASRESARTMYVDETPRQERQPMPSIVRERGAGRPTKKERREIEKLSRK